MQELEASNIGHYHIQCRLARGGMSEIYLANDLQSGQLVAIKLVHSSNSDYYARFRHEVQAMSALQHEHILPVIDYGECGRWYYLATPYIGHGTLNDRLALGTLSLKEAGELLEQLTAALQFAHEQGIIHRDIKPSNVLLRDGYHVYLADFGLAKKVGDDPSLTVSSVMIGTPEYMAPELAEELASPRSDIYALGVLLYRMLTGKVPFSASTPLAVFLKHVTEQPQPPSRQNPTIPKAVENVILHALEKDPRKRFRTALDLMEAYRRATAVETPRLRALAECTTLAPLLKQSIPHVRQVSKRRPLTGLITAGAGLLLLLPLSIGMTFSERQPLQASALPHSDTVSVAPVAPGKPHTTPGKSTETTGQKQGWEVMQSYQTIWTLPNKPNKRNSTLNTGDGGQSNQQNDSGQNAGNSGPPGQQKSQNGGQHGKGNGQQSNQQNDSGQNAGNSGPPGQQKGHNGGQHGKGNGHGKGNSGKQ